MALTPDKDQLPATGDDLRRLERRLDARLQEVNARLVLHDGRFAALTDRVNQLDRRADALAAHMAARLGTVDARFDKLDERHDKLDARHAQIRADAKEMASEYRTAVIRATLIGVGVTFAVNASMIGATVWVVLG